MPQKKSSNYETILIEKMDANMGIVLEHVSGVESRLIQQMKHSQAQNNARFEIIEAVLRKHSAMLQRNEERWERNEQLWKRHEERLVHIDERLSRVENKLDRVTIKVDRHDRELKSIQASTKH